MNPLHQLILTTIALLFMIALSLHGKDDRTVEAALLAHTAQGQRRDGLSPVPTALPEEQPR